jgi:hypothetical protein
MAKILGTMKFDVLLMDDGAISVRRDTQLSKGLQAMEHSLTPIQVEQAKAMRLSISQMVSNFFLFIHSKPEVLLDPAASATVPALVPDGPKLLPEAVKG